MIKQDNLHFNSKDKLQLGINKIADAVGGTMGTGGSNATIEAIENPGYLMTNDGYTIASSIVLADPIEDMGRKMLLEAINRANKASGDGSSTTCVLTAAIINEGLKRAGEAHPMDIKRSLEDCLPFIETNLTSQTRPLVNEDGSFDIALLEQVATISAEDPEIGKTISTIYQEIGKDGLIYWDISKTSADTYTLGSGITVEGAGYLSPYMTDISEDGKSTNSIRIKNPYILLTKQKIASANDIGDIAATLNAKEVKDLVIFADDVDPLVVPDLIKTRLVRGFRIAVVKMPVFWKDWWYEDLAKATGATVIDPVAGLPLKSVTESHLGRVGNIIIAKEDTFLDGIKDVTAHVATLLEDPTDDNRLRASRLNTKTARYFVGAQSDAALSYRRLKVEDAISASYQALQGGIVPGGGVALRNVANNLSLGTIGADILLTALKAPLDRILLNAGASDEDTQFVYEAVEARGYNTKTRKICDMFDSGILDPKNVVLNAVKNALSVASSVITAPTIVTLPRDEYDFNPMAQQVIKR